ncbi:MAG: 5'-nucleotidase C-terminal domain-containing protein [Propionibacteriaceae bacterium]|nr:5'-nucleotidase C-terminal domain-containing protein [Propionibacteriaceae bacterium]
MPTLSTKLASGLSAIVVALAGAVVVNGSPAQAAPETELVPVHIFTFNDFHGRIDSSDSYVLPFAYTLEKAVLVDNDPRDSMIVSAGDNIGASLFASAIANDNPTLTLLNDLAATDQVNFKASAVGNHEFDKGLTDLRDRVIGGVNADGSPATAKAEGWSYLGANVVSKDDGKPVLDPYQIYHLGNGLTVGVIGVVTQETPTLVSAGGVSTVNFADPVATVNRYATQLKDGDPDNGEADIVVAVYHEGTSITTGLDDALVPDAAFTRIVNDSNAQVDAIVNGHTHRIYAWNGLGEEDPEGLDTHPGRVVVQADQYGRHIGQIDLMYDPATKTVQSGAGKVVQVDTKVAIDYTVGSMRTIREHVNAALDEAKVLGAPTVGAMSSSITAPNIGGEWVLGSYDGQSVLRYQDTGSARGGSTERANESSLATLVADAFLDTAVNSDVIEDGADIGIVNAGGGIRADLLYGDDGIISYAEANAVLPFTNNLDTIELTGAQLKQFLEQQWRTTAEGVSGRPFLVTGVSSNVTYTVDTDVPEALACVIDHCAWDDPSSHVTSVFVNGVPLDPDKTYKIITLSFLTDGSDGYTIMKQGVNRQDTGLVDRDAWISYLQKASGLTAPGGTPTTTISPSFARPSVVVSNLTPATAAMDSTPVVAGGEVTAAVSRLDLTSLGAVANTTMDTYLLPLASASADPTTGVKLASTPVTAPGDEAGCRQIGVPEDLRSYGVDGGAPSSSGCAKLDVTIPSDTAAGQYVLVSVAQPSSTRITLALTVDAAAVEPAPEGPSVVAPGVPGAVVHTGGQISSGWPPIVVGLSLVMIGATVLIRRVLPQ